MKVLVLGASDNLDRYSYKALMMLKEAGHDVIPIHPRLERIEDVPVINDLSDVQGPVDTITLYVNAARSSPLIEQILSMAPRRIVMNPGAENLELESKARAAGIDVVCGCTLVMLSTGQF